MVRRSLYSLAGTFHRRSSRLLKTGFFKQVRELKIQRKNPGSALQIWIVISKYFPPTKSKTKVHKKKYTRTTTTTTTTKSHNSATLHCMFQKYDSHFHVFFIQKVHAPTLITLVRPSNKSISGKQCSVCDPAKAKVL